MVVDGLAGADSSKYNGHVGVVISGVDGGRQGVRLEGAPFANKKLHLKVSNLFGALAAAEEEDDEAAAEEEMEDAKMAEAGAATPKKALARHARALGLTLVDLGLAPAKDSAAEAATDAAAASVANDGAAPDDSLTGFALSGDLPAQRLAAARRCALRDADGDEAESSAAELAHKALAGAIRLSAAAAAAAAAPVADVSDGDAAAAASPAAASPAAASATSAGPSRRLLMSPDARVRHGALGPRVAAAARQAFGGKSVSEMQDGLAELKEALLDELDRGAREQFSLGRGLQDESSDALRLRLVLSLANLESGADTQALEEAREAALAHPDAPAASLVYARCLLRVGKREEALVLLRKAAAEGAATASAGGGSSGGGGVGAKDEGGEEEEDEEEDEEGDDEEEGRRRADGRERQGGGRNRRGMGSQHRFPDAPCDPGRRATAGGRHGPLRARPLRRRDGSVPGGTRMHRGRGDGRRALPRRAARQHRRVPSPRQEAGAGRLRVRPSSRPPPTLRPRTLSQGSLPSRGGEARRGRRGVRGALPSRPQLAQTLRLAVACPRRPAPHGRAGRRRVPGRHARPHSQVMV